MSAVPVKARVYRLPRPGGSYGPGEIWVWKCAACRKNRLGCAHRAIHPSGTWRAAMCGAFRHVHVEHPRRAYDGSLTHQVMLGRWRCDISRPTPLEAAEAWDIAAGPRGGGGMSHRAAFAAEILALEGQALAAAAGVDNRPIRFTW